MTLLLLLGYSSLSPGSPPDSQLLCRSLPTSPASSSLLHLYSVLRLLSPHKDLNTLRRGLSILNLSPELEAHICLLDKLKRHPRCNVPQTKLQICLPKSVFPTIFLTSADTTLCFRFAPMGVPEHLCPPLSLTPTSDPLANPVAPSFRYFHKPCTSCRLLCSHCGPGQQDSRSGPLTGRPLPSALHAAARGIL